MGRARIDEVSTYPIPSSRPPAGALLSLASNALSVQRTAGNAATTIYLQRGRNRGVAVREHEKGAREGTRGHVLEKHVGKSKEWLQARAVKDGLEMASSFLSEDQANEAVQFCLKVNDKEVEEFINGTSGPNKKDFSTTTKHPIGFGVRQDGRIVKGLRRITLVLTRQGGGQWQILTAFPSS